MRCSPGDDRGRSDPGAGLARRALGRGYRRGAGAAVSGAAAFARRHSRSRPGRRPVARRSRPGQRRPRAARRGSRRRVAAEERKIIAASRMAEGSVWFRAAIGRRKNAEARWLLPMICRRGGIDKQDIGAIRIMDTTTEFEISERVAESFAVKIRRPDKEDNIRIEPLSDAPQAQAAPEQQSHAPRRETEATDRGARQNDKPRDEGGRSITAGPTAKAGRDLARRRALKRKSDPGTSLPTPDNLPARRPRNQRFERRQRRIVAQCRDQARGRAWEDQFHPQINLFRARVDELAGDGP